MKSEDSYCNALAFPLIHLIKTMFVVCNMIIFFLSWLQSEL